ncbi:hypothetical protein EST38_g1365 [Candolleomyces aberdarensis]|uniref:HpcH/HpaI aldolase/citrate lyase domain-containing protein n=1 Tax=Candolleomyces aberdarensis TaxID=2316362 RepID=A0A4Q2DZM5_9AGAR|nr:hypothetical protein EST38_g1365 [Candolleomyces aberdarensis]
MALASFLSAGRTLSRHCRVPYSGLSRRFISSKPSLRRSWIYVPSSSERMLQKSLGTGSDVIIYDLEDSVAPSPEDKANARANLKKFLKEADIGPNSPHITVRVNDISTPYFEEDIKEILSNIKVGGVVLAKTHAAEDLDVLSNALREAPLAEARAFPVEIIPSLESARAMWNLRDIAAWKSKHEPRLGGELKALMLVIAAKAFGLDVVDMYKDKDYLRDECVDGRQLGFTGKQAIHPSQVPIIQSTFVPTPEEILRAAKILKGLKNAHISEAKGAIGIDGEMIDAPMLKQAEQIIAIAEAANLTIPNV